MQTAVSACKRKGLFSDFDDAIAKVVDLNEKLATYREVIAKAKTGKKKETTVEPMADVEESVKDALAESAVAREEQLTAAEGFFSQYANLLPKKPGTTGTRLSKPSAIQPRGSIYWGKNTSEQGGGPQVIR